MFFIPSELFKLSNNAKLSKALTKSIAFLKKSYRFWSWTSNSGNAMCVSLPERRELYNPALFRLYSVNDGKLVSESFFLNKNRLRREFRQNFQQYSLRLLSNVEELFNLEKSRCCSGVMAHSMPTASTEKDNFKERWVQKERYVLLNSGSQLWEWLKSSD